MKKQIMIFAGVGVLLVALTAVGTYLFVAPKLMAAGASTAQKNIVVPTPPSYDLGPTATIDTLILNLADPGANRYLKIQVVMAFSPVLDKQSDVTKIVTERMPILQDLLTATAGDATTTQLATSQGKDALKQALIKQFSAVLVELHLVDLFFPIFVMQ